MNNQPSLRLLFVSALLICLGFAQVSPAAPSESASISELDSIAPERNAASNVTRGTVAIGLGSSAGYSSYKGYEANPLFQLKYFLADKLALGLTARDFTNSSGRVGPAIEYYFKTSDRWAFFVGQEYSVVVARPSMDQRGYEEGDWLSITRIGSKYFLSSQFAVGADLTYQFNTFRLANRPLAMSAGAAAEVQIGYFF